MNIQQNKTDIIYGERHLELLTSTVVKNSIDLGDSIYIDTYKPGIDKDVCDEFNIDYHELLNKENLSESSISGVGNLSITTAAATLSYARIHMIKIMMFILENGGTIYYTDTDSIVTDFELPEHYIDPVKLGKLKLEHIIEQGYFVADKTYAFIDSNGKLKKASKGVKSSSLDYLDYEKMYNMEVVDAKKTSSIRNYKDGYVTISNDIIKLNPTSYKKRGRVIMNGK